MPETIEHLRKKLNHVTQPRVRNRLAARGAARAMVWNNGVLPADGPQLGELLTEELLAFGFGTLRVALKARETGVSDASVDRAFETAAESLEAVVKNGDPDDECRGFYRVVSAAAYHLARFSARAFSLLAQGLSDQNLSVIERAFSQLILRDLTNLEVLLLSRINDPALTDEAIVAAFSDKSDGIDSESAVLAVVEENYLRALACLIFAIRTGDEGAVGAAQERLLDGEAVCLDFGFIPSWWIFRLTRFLTEDMWMSSLQKLLPKAGGDSSRWDELRELFVAVLASRRTAELELWPSQVEIASRVLDTTDNVIASLPTSAGKTRIAELCILRALSLGQRVVFVTPLRALSAQTERTLRETFRPLGVDVSSLYGSAGSSSFDIDSLRNREIVVSTPEKLDFALRNDSSLLDDVGLVVLDEGHMLGPTEREVRYEVLIQRLLRRADAASRRIVCLSAMLPVGNELADFVAWLRSDKIGNALTSTWRPTRQRFGNVRWLRSAAKYELKIESETTFIARFVEEQQKIGSRGGHKAFPDDQNSLTLAAAWRLVADRHSVLIYCPERRSANAIAKCVVTAYKNGFLGTLVRNPAKLEKAISIGKEWLGAEHHAVKCLKLGVALHHGALPRPFLREIDALLRDKEIQVVIASPTLARGLNISASCVLFQSCRRYDQRTEKRVLISAEEFSNVAGRAGRAYVDLDGQVLGICFKPEHFYDWNTLVSQQNQRRLESGLLLLIERLFFSLARKPGLNAADLREYVLNNSSVWDAPPGDENQISEWHTTLATLDLALLSLIGDFDCDATNVAVVLDEILKSSFLRRRLQHRIESSRLFVEAVIAKRAEFICSTSTAPQRKGYFFSGVGLTAGQFLDGHSDELNQSLVDANDAFLNGETDRCIASLLNIAELVFQIVPFTPQKFPDEWKDIMAGWLTGVPMTDLQELNEEAATFIEDGLVYRFVWAVEAIRVRSRANEEGVFDDEPSPIVAAIETGTMSIQQALLLQAGLASRVAASAAIAECPGYFNTMAQMRVWLESEEVQTATRKLDFPTDSSRLAWLDFVQAQGPATQMKWAISEFDMGVTPGAGCHLPPSGTPVCALQPDGAEAIKVLTREMVEIGDATMSLVDWARRWSQAIVLDSEHVRVRYVGPMPDQ